MKALLLSLINVVRHLQERIIAIVGQAVKLKALNKAHIKKRGRQMFDWPLRGVLAQKQADLLVADEDGLNTYGKKYLKNCVEVLLRGDISFDEDRRILGVSHDRLTDGEAKIIEVRAKRIVMQWRTEEGDLSVEPDIAASEEATVSHTGGDAAVKKDSSSDSDHEWPGAGEEVPIEALGEPELEDISRLSLDELVKRLMPVSISIEPQSDTVHSMHGSQGRWSVQGHGTWPTSSDQMVSSIGHSLITLIRDKLELEIRAYMEAVARMTPCCGCTRSYATGYGVDSIHFGFACPHRPDDIMEALKFAKLITREGDGLFIRRVGEEADKEHRLEKQEGGYDIGVLIQHETTGKPIAAVHVVGLGDVWPECRRQEVDPRFKVRLLSADAAQEAGKDDIPLPTETHRVFRGDDDIPF